MEGEQGGFQTWIPLRRRLNPDDPFFAAGDTERELLAKHVALDLTEDERYQFMKMENGGLQNVVCPIAGCGYQLDCLEDFEDHYNARHTASCSVCSRVYPTARLLSIHVSEVHDSFFKEKVARGFAMFECLVEGCNIKLKSYRSRQQHLMDKHSFPSSFEFYKKSRPSKHQRQKHQHRRTREDQPKGMHMDVDAGASKHGADAPILKKEIDMEVEAKIDDLTSAVSKLSTSDSYPSSISFGRRHARGLAFVPRSIQQGRKQRSQKGE